MTLLLSTSFRRLIHGNGWLQHLYFPSGSLLWLSSVTNIWLRSCDKVLSWISTEALTQGSRGNVWSDAVLPLISLAKRFLLEGSFCWHTASRPTFLQYIRQKLRVNHKEERVVVREEEEVWWSYRVRNCEIEERAGKEDEEEATAAGGNSKSKEEKGSDLISEKLTGLIHAKREDVNEASGPVCLRKSRHREKDVHHASSEVRKSKRKENRKEETVRV